MSPQVFGFVAAYPLAVILAVATGVGVLVPVARRERTSLLRVLLAQAILSAAGITGALVYNLVETNNLGSIGWRSFAEGGMRYPGGIIAIAAAMPLARLFLPKHLGVARFLDMLAPSAAFAMSVMRGGCFLVGCCYGQLSNLPWAVSFPPRSQVAFHHAIQGLVPPGSWSLSVHPLQLYFSLASFAVGVFLLRLSLRKSYHGEVFLCFLAIHEGAKASLELLRGSLPTDSVSHLRYVALFFSVAGIAVLLLRRRGYLANVFPAAIPTAGLGG